MMFFLEQVIFRFQGVIFQGVFFFGGGIDFDHTWPNIEDPRPPNVMELAVV